MRHFWNTLIKRGGGKGFLPITDICCVPIVFPGFWYSDYWNYKYVHSLRDLQVISYFFSYPCMITKTKIKANLACMCYSKFIAYLISGEPHNNPVRNYYACHFVETEVRKVTYLKKQMRQVTCWPKSHNWSKAKIIFIPALIPETNLLATCFTAL